MGSGPCCARSPAELCPLGLLGSSCSPLLLLTSLCRLPALLLLLGLLLALLCYKTPHRQHMLKVIARRRLFDMRHWASQSGGHPADPALRTRQCRAWHLLGHLIDVAVDVEGHQPLLVFSDLLLSLSFELSQGSWASHCSCIWGCLCASRVGISSCCGG